MRQEVTPVRYFATSYRLNIWTDNKANRFTLVLQHRPKELQAELNIQEAWEGVKNAMSVVCLIILIHDLWYNKSDRKQSIMAKVKADFNI